MLNALNTLLLRHRVDMGRTLGVLLIAGGFVSVYIMVFDALFKGTWTWDLGALLYLALGFGLCRHKAFARTLALVIGWALVVLSVVMMFAILAKRQGSGLTMGFHYFGTNVVNPPYWKMLIGWFMVAPALGLALAALHTETAKAEFGSRP